jgi:hypothetical protein
MRRLNARLAAASALAVATAVCTSGAAFAGGDHGNGNGNANGNGQSAQVQASQSSSGASTTTTQAQAGVKPSSKTTHWTHCTTGGSSSSTTCTSSDNGHTPQPNADASKRYGNGKTAAQIAVSRGGTGVELTGPGNSQPHKVSDCSHKRNKSGGVDVHAIKSYSTTGCTSADVKTTGNVRSSEHGKSSAHAKSSEHVKVVVHGKSSEQHGAVKTTTPVESGHKVTLCHATGSATNPYVMITVDYHALKNGHTAAKGDIIPPTTVNGVTYSGNWDTNGQAIFNNGCKPPAAQAPVITPATPATTATTTAQTTTQAEAPVTTTNTVPSTVTVIVTTPVTVTNTVAATTTAAAAPPAAAPSNGGVLGAQTSLASPKKSNGGVLGTVGNVAGSSLPFTGFPVWLVVLIAVALILAGIALRRRTLGPGL